MTYKMSLLLVLDKISVQKTITLGLLFTKDVRNLEYTVGYENSAGAILVAEDRIRQDHLLDDYDFKYIVAF